MATRLTRDEGEGAAAVHGFAPPSAGLRVVDIVDRRQVTACAIEAKLESPPVAKALRRDDGADHRAAIQEDTSKADEAVQAGGCLTIGREPALDSSARKLLCSRVRRSRVLHLIEQPER